MQRAKSRGAKAGLGRPERAQKCTCAVGESELNGARSPRALLPRAVPLQRRSSSLPCLNVGKKPTIANN
jgi:hypothetical protein